MQKSAFTMIELIFVILVIGILASIAIPKMNAVRGDAQLAKDVSNMAICIRDAGNQYTATGINLDANDSQVCSSVVCFTITYDTNETNFTVSANPNGAPYCQDIATVGEHLIGEHKFRGKGIKF